MSARRDPSRDHADGFAARSFSEGRLDDYERATRFGWAVEDRAREQRARKLARLRIIPWWGWGVVALAAFGLLVWVVAWVTAHLVASMILGVLLVCIAGVLLWRPDAPAPPPVPVAPHDVRHTVRLDPLGLVLSADARAVADAVDAGRRNYYLDALTRGVLPAPSRIRDVGRDVVSVPLPGGRITPDDVDLARFATTLGVAPTRVRRGPDRPGLLVVDVLDVDPATMRAPAWPALGQPARWDEPMPFGVDEVGQPVTVKLAGRRVLVGGQSGSGKTRLIRAFGLYAAADPRVTLHVVDLKGSPALSCLRERAAWFHAGPADDAVVDHLRTIRDDMRARYERMRNGADVVAESGWVVIIGDEVQGLWRVKGADEVVEEIARMGREAGVGLVLGSQTPDKASVPTIIGEQADLRVALRLPARWASGMILGDGGEINAAQLPTGHAWVCDDGAAPARVATYHVDDEQAVDHLAAAAPPALPAGLPVLLAMPDADDRIDDEDDEPDLLAAVASIIGTRAGATWPELVVTLDRDADTLRAALRPHGITSATFKADGRTVRGVRRGDVEAALDRA